MIWLVLAIVAGLLLGKLLGFMTVEFVMRPLALLMRCGAALFGAVADWGRRL
jgi:Na+/H+ antiporter NhaA